MNGAAEMAFVYIGISSVNISCVCVCIIPYSIEINTIITYDSNEKYLLVDLVCASILATYRWNFDLDGE